MTRGCILILASLLLLLFAGACLAADFSADMFIGDKSLNKMGKIYSSGKMVRLEQGVGANQRVTIVRVDKKTAYMINPQNRTYMQMALPKGAQADPRSDAVYAANTIKKNLGTEVVNGYTCAKTAYVSKRAPKATTIRCYSQKLEWPVKTQINMPGGKCVTQELRNIKIAKQPMRLFEVPSGYKRVETPKVPPPGPKGLPKNKSK
jgi:outer membrane lipoprotein-sorting protein